VKLTLKDFILYNSPCFSCGNNTQLEFFLIDRGGPTPLNVALKTNILGSHIEVIVKVTYKSSLSITIDPKHNSWVSNNATMLHQLLSQYGLYVTSDCKICGTYICSNAFTILWSKKLILPLDIEKEFVIIKTDKGTYYLSTYEKDITLLEFTKNKLNSPIFELKIPKLLICDLKDKDALIKKINTYMLFS